MPDESMARTVVALSDVFESMISPEGSKPHWFISFGTLLWFVRDRLLERPFEEDIDISMIYGAVKREDLIAKFGEYGYQLESEVLDNYHRKPLQMVFKPVAPGLWPTNLDIYFWVIGHEFAWHTYDMFNRGVSIMDEYTFKGTPRALIEAPTLPMVWEEIAPTIQFPSKYGSLLDVWYPPNKDHLGNYIINSCWMIQNKQYGQSKFDTMKTIKSCKDMPGDLG